MQDNSAVNAYTIAELDERGPVCKSTLYAEIKAGRLVARKIGRRTIILDSDWRAFLEGAPTITPAAPARPTPAATTGRRPRGRPRKVPVVPTPTQRVPSENIPERAGPLPAPPMQGSNGSLLGQGHRRSQKTGKTADPGAAS
jgi:hypothetical protein